MTNPIATAETVDQDEYIWVQFVPCGDTYRMKRSEIIAVIGTPQLDDIASGRKLEAPVLPSEKCKECKDYFDHQDELCARMDLDVDFMAD